MKAYLLNDDNLEFIWSWEPDRAPRPEPRIEASAQAEEASLQSAPDLSNIESSLLAFSTTLSDLSSAIQSEHQWSETARPASQPPPAATEAALVAISGAVRQHEEELQRIDSKVESASRQGESLAARVDSLESAAGQALEQTEALGRTAEWLNFACRQIQALNAQMENLEERLAAQQVSLSAPAQEQGALIRELDARLLHAAQGSESNTELIAALKSRFDLLERRLVAIESAALFASAKVEDLEGQLRDLSRQADASVAGAAEPLPDARSRRSSLAKRRGRRLLIGLAAAPLAVVLCAFGIRERSRFADLLREPQSIPAAAHRAAIEVPQLPAVYESADPSTAAGLDNTSFSPGASSSTASSGTASDSMSGAEKVLVVVTAEEPAWLEAEADGQKIFAKLIQARETRSFDATSKLVLRTGNLAGVSVSHNGKAIGRLGTVHRVGRVLFTPAGWQIL